METNLELSSDKHSTLKVAGQALLDAAMDYFYEYRRATGGAAVIWIKDTDGRMVILTRGEYADTLMRNIDVLKRHEELVVPFETQEDDHG